MGGQIVDTTILAAPFAHRGKRGATKQAIGISRSNQTTKIHILTDVLARAVIQLTDGKATIQKLRVTEVPTTTTPDGRNRPPHLRSWRDGAVLV
jgi:hypothetical protein